MGSQQAFRVKLLVQLVLGSLLSIGAEAALAQDPIDLGTVQSSASGASTSDAEAAKQASAPYQAPTQGSLVASQPQSIIGEQYIRENAAASANYSDIASIAPSVSDIEPNGPGLMESQGLSMRGFQNGQYNVTFDGIPWGDSNDFTQHSTSYFMSQDVGSVVVDRGPGSASTIGDATFGGTIATTSKAPLAESAITPYATLGSFNTHLEGLQVDTGILQNYGDASLFVDYRQLDSDGYLDYSAQKRQNFFAKLVRPVGDNTLLTLVAMYNKLHQNVSLGSTQAQIQQYGPTHALNADPTSQAYYGYNYDDISSDFEYIGLNSQQGIWRIDNKLYTYAYDHHGFNGMDPNGETPNGTSYGANNVPGQKMTMVYRSIGDVLRLTRPTGPGDLKFGMWYDHQSNTRSEWTVDYTLGGAIDYGAGGYDRLMDDSLETFQPYVEYDWKATDALTVTPGVKYVSFRRSLDATVNQKTGTPLSYSKTWTKALPSLGLHYAFQPNWTGYLQWAKGFLAPNLNTFYTVDPSASSVEPETTTNTQLGTTWKSERLTLSGDVYYIDFDNLVQKRTVAGNTVFFNEGGVVYKGVEGEGTYYVGSGFSLYGNLSFNSAKDKGSDQWVPNAPDRTAAAGVIYNQGPYYASLIAKNVGSRYGDTGETYHLSSYTVANLAASYTIRHGTGWYKNAKFGFQVNNLFDKTDIYALAGYTGGANTPLYWTIPGRSYMFTASVSM